MLRTKLPRTPLKSRRPRLESLERRAMLAADAIEVFNTNDAGEGSLRDAIAQANANEGEDTIVFRRGVRGEIELSSELIVSDDLVIRGPGAHRLTVSGNDNSRVFRVDADPSQRFGVPVDESGDPLSIDVAIHHLTIADGLATDAPGFPPTDPSGAPLFPGFGFGGGLYNRGNNVTLVGVDFVDNQAGSETLPVEGFGSGATYDQSNGEYGGPAGTSNLGPISIAGVVNDISIIEDPDAPPEVFFQANFGGEQMITDDNGDAMAGIFSGIVVFQINEDGLTTGVWEALFEVNPLTSTGRYAGATGTLEIVAVNPPGFNPAGPTLPFDWTVSGELNQPVGGAAGGAIANEFGGTLEVHGGHFEDNVAQGGFLSVGGAITQDIGPTADGLGTDSPSTVVKRATFRGNQARSLASNPDTAGPFAPFAGWALGGAIANVAGDLEVSRSSFHKNVAQGGDGAVTESPFLAQGNGGNAIGGAINQIDFSPFDTVGVPGRDASMEITSTRFVSNVATGGDAALDGTGGQGIGGAIGFGISYGEALGFSDDSGRVTRSQFSRNVAEGGAGGSDGGTGGDAAGGAIGLTTAAGLEVGTSKFRTNEALGGDGPTDGQGGDGLGGAIGLDVLGTIVPIPGLPVGELASTIDVYRGHFYGNLAAGGDGGLGGNGLGGAVGNAGPVNSLFGTQSTAELARSIILRNKAVGGEGESDNGGDAFGGGVYNGNDSTTILSRDLIFANLAKAGSGGIAEGNNVFNAEDGADPGTLETDRFTDRLLRIGNRLW